MVFDFVNISSLAADLPILFRIGQSVADFLGFRSHLVNQHGQFRAVVEDHIHGVTAVNLRISLEAVKTRHVIRPEEIDKPMNLFPRRIVDIGIKTLGQTVVRQNRRSIGNRSRAALKQPCRQQVASVCEIGV